MAGRTDSSTESSIVISASPAAVMAVIADLEAYPEWSSDVKSVEVLTVDGDDRPEQARFVIDSGAIKDTYTLAYAWTGDERVTWTMAEAGSLLKDLDGSYALTGNASSTEVTYRLTVELKIPMIGLIKRKAEKVIVDTALKGLKARVED